MASLNLQSFILATCLQKKPFQITLCKLLPILSRNIKQLMNSYQVTAIKMQTEMKKAVKIFWLYLAINFSQFGIIPQLESFVRGVKPLLDSSVTALA